MSQVVTSNLNSAMPQIHHCVYVIELDPAVLTEPRFREANMSHNPAKPCVYVGMTGLAPEERFRRHQAGIQDAPFVRKYGIRLRPRLYARYNPMSYADACAMEKALAERLRNRGYAVWQH
jgi:hypothetical protein